MNIAVLIKQVPVSNDVSVDPVTHALIRESSEGMINPADLNAIEAALVLKEQEGGKVVVFTMGPPDAAKALREAMAIGCDEACLISDRAVAGGDTVATSYVLAEAIKKYGEFDLIVAGALSADGATGQVGPMVAETLKIPQIAEVTAVSYDSAMPGKITATKKMYDNQVTVRTSLPAVVTFNFGCNEPRLATLRSTRAAKKKPLETYTNEILQMPLDKIGAKGSPTLAIDSFTPEMVSRATMLEGSAAELAQKLKDLLEEEGV